MPTPFSGSASGWRQGFGRGSKPTRLEATRRAGRESFRIVRSSLSVSTLAGSLRGPIPRRERRRLERGLKQIRDRRQFVQWTDALGVPEELLGLLPTADPHVPDSMGRLGTADTGARGYAALPEGPGQLLLPAGRSVSMTALPVLTLPAASFLGDIPTLSAVDHGRYSHRSAITGRVPPVGLISGNGPVLSDTYGFPGSEKDLCGRGLIGDGDLSPYQARLLLQALLTQGADGATVRETFTTTAR